VLAEFDEAKRSCRKRLTEHNRRRRKPISAQGKDSSPPPPPPKKADTCITTSYSNDLKSKKLYIILASLLSDLISMHLISKYNPWIETDPTELFISSTADVQTRYKAFDRKIL
jgi:hypothetical protein